MPETVPPSDAAKRVLVVDDSLTVRMDLQDALEEDGFEVMSSGTAADARRILSHFDFDLAVLDVLLPDGNGVDILIELRQDPRTAHVPVMMLSSEREVTARIHGLVSGADEYVGKPYDGAYLRERARALVGQQPAARLTSPLRDDAARPVVLAVDDSPTYLHALTNALQGSGYDVVTAVNGDEALRKLASGTYVDAVVLDHMMPGLSGPETTRRLRMNEEHTRTPVLILTTREKVEDAISALDAGADDHVPKSGNFAVLHARLKAHLRRRQLERQHVKLEAEVARFRTAERASIDQAAKGWALLAARMRSALAGARDPRLASDLDELQLLAPRPVGPASAVEAAAVVASAVRAAGATVSVDVSPMAPLHADADRLVALLVRVLHGLTALGSGGPLAIEVRPAAPHAADIRVRAAVDPALAARALVPFAIAEPRDWRLHLAIAARSAADLGLSIAVTAEGPDAVVTLRIP